MRKQRTRMRDEEDPVVRFVPRDCTGWPDVMEVVVYPNRIEFKTSGEWKRIGFESIIRWPRPAWLWKALTYLGKRPDFLPIGERDWFHVQGEKFFTFYTQPPLTIFFPAEKGVGYQQHLLRRVKDVIQAGGYDNFDLG